MPQVPDAPLTEPTLKPISIADLRPTQMTVGLREVEEKRRQWRELSEKHGPEFLGRHMVPTVLGPKGRHYVLDHHHLVRALHDEGVTQVLATVEAELSALSKTSFWVYLDNRAWCHPYDDSGTRRDFDAIPDNIGELKDDPYRSLSGELRQRFGGFAKDTTPFSAIPLGRLPPAPGSRPRRWASDFSAALAKAHAGWPRPGTPATCRAGADPTRSDDPRSGSRSVAARGVRARCG